MWHHFDQMTTPDALSAEAQVALPADSAWFDGHFPGMPLLPGIAQLAMVETLIARAWSPPRRVAQFSRVRFKLKIDPDTVVTVKVKRNPEKEALFGFQILTPDGVACVGNALAPVTD